MYDFLKDLDEEELIKLRNYLTQVRFFNISDCRFAFIVNENIYERYANVTLGGYKKDTIIKVSELFLVDETTKRDIFTGENFESSWGGHDNDGFIGGWYSLDYFKGSLLSLVQKYGISYQKVYSDIRIEELLNLYNECMKEFLWNCTLMNGEKIRWPHREYKIEDGKIHALRPLKYITTYNDK